MTFVHKLYQKQNEEDKRQTLRINFTTKNKRDNLCDPPKRGRRQYSSHNPSTKEMLIRTSLINCKNTLKLLIPGKNLYHYHQNVGKV